MKHLLHKLSSMRLLMLLAVLLGMGSSAAWADTKTLTLDYNSFGLSTSYATKTATVDGFGFTVNQGYKGSGNVIQMNSSKGSGILYNTTAISGLKSITVNVSSGSKTYTITTGTSEKPTANSQTGSVTGTYNAASGDTYFQLKVSGASYFSSIVITYETGGGDDNDLALTGAPIALNFDLYNNSSAQTVNFTTSSTGAVTIADNDYATFDIDEDNKTITVTPTAVTPSTQTITVNQAADDSYMAGSTTFTLTITDSTPIPTHTATFSVNGETTSDTFEEGAAITFPANPGVLHGKTFVGWVAEAIDGTTDDAPEFVTSATMGDSDVTYYAVFADVTAGTQTIITDNLTSSTFGSPGSYTTWSGKSTTDGSAAVYAGNSTTKPADTAIQIRAQSPSGIVSTTSGGKVKKVTVKWNAGTSTGRSLDVYGKNTAYTEAANLYGTATVQGTKIGSIVYGTSTELTISDDYEYIGMRSNNGAMYLNQISIEWSTGTPDTYSSYCTTVVAAAVEKPTIEVAANPFVISTTATISCETEGAAIKYSFDGETWNDYTEELTITETTTIYAKAVKNEDVSEVASVTATKNLAVPTVTINADGITNTNVFDGAVAGSLVATVTYNDAAVEGAIVTWSGDNDEVATIDASTGAVTLVAAGTVTFTATYAGNSDYSEKAETYVMTVTNTDPNAPGTENNPYTVAQARDAIDAGTGITNVYATGIVSQAGTVNSNGQISYYISADGTTTSDQLQAYKGKGIGGANFEDDDDIQVGDVVVIYGTLKKYNAIYEFDQNNQLVSLTRKADSDFAISSETNVELQITSAELHPTSQITYISSSTGDVIFVSNDDAVVTVSDEGIITAQGEGTTTITVMQDGDSNYKASAEMTIGVTVSDNRSAVATDIDLPAAQKTLVVGDMDDFTATGTVDAGFTGTVVYTYETSDASIVDVVEGTFSAEAPGTADITITATPTDGNAANYKSASQVVTVTVKGTTTLELSDTEDIETYGTPMVFTATIADGYDGVLLTESSNDLVATAAIDGTTITVTSQAVGTAVITVTAPETEVFAGEVSKYFSVEFVQPAASTEAYVAMQTLFDETFDKCEGTGGRDGEYTGSVGTSSTSGKLDESWESIGSNGAYQCIKVGTGSAAQYVTTSKINVTGNGTLTFSAAGWGDTKNNTLTVSSEDATLSGDTNITLENGTWNSYTVNITEGTGDVAITFTMKRGFLDDVKVTKGGAPLSVTLNASGYATYCSQYPLDFTGDNDYSAWQITGISEDAGNYTIIFSEITDVIAGGQGILLKGLANTTIELASSADNKETLDNNKFVGTIAPAYVESNEFYGLKANNFVHVNAGVVPANKALLPANLIDSSVEVKGFTFVFEDMATGIRTIEKVTPAEAAEIFNLGGQRMNKVQRGINIVNGRKVLVK